MATPSTPAPSIGQQLGSQLVAQIPSLLPGAFQALSDLIAGLVHKNAPIVQASNGPSTGPIKLGDLVMLVQKALIGAHAAGTLTGTLPDDATVGVIVQSMISIMKLPGGQLGPAVAGSPASGDPVSVKSGTPVTLTIGGQSVTITVGA
jgi:hypothetical protein